MLGTGIFWIDGFASGKAFILAVVKTDAVFPQPPAQEHFFILDYGGKVHKARIQVFHDAARRLDLVESVLDLGDH